MEFSSLRDMNFSLDVLEQQLDCGDDGDEDGDNDNGDGGDNGSITA